MPKPLQHSILLLAALLALSSCHEDGLRYPEPGGITYGQLSQEDEIALVKQWTGLNPPEEVDQRISHFQYHHDGEKLIGFHYVVYRMDPEVAMNLECHANKLLNDREDSGEGIAYEYPNYFVEHYGGLTIDPQKPCHFWSDGNPYGLRAYIELDPVAGIMRVSQGIGAGPDPLFADYLADLAADEESLEAE